MRGAGDPSPTASTTASSQTRRDARVRAVRRQAAVGPELWVMLLEKAWAAPRGGYQQIHFGQATDGPGSRALTGTATRSPTENDRQIMRNIRKAIDDGRPVICSTPGP